MKVSAIISIIIAITLISTVLVTHTLLLKSDSGDEKSFLSNIPLLNKPDDVPGDNSTIFEEEPEEQTHSLVMVKILNQTGPAGRSSPSGTPSTVIQFNLEEGGKILVVNLSCLNPGSSTDYDLVVRYPDGSTAGQSAGPDANEQIILETRNNGTLPAGTYEAEIVFWLMATGTTWHLEVTAWYQTTE